MAALKRLVILDTHAILHRAYHALPDFASSRGEPTGALYGLITMLVKLIADLKPDYIVAAFDLPKPTHRHLAYKDYKSTRPRAADDLVAQIIRSRDVLSAFGVPMYEKEGFEADDVIGTIVEEMKNVKDVELVIASGDMDTMQLIEGKKVRVYTLKKGISDTILYDEEAVKERYGFPPEHIADYKGLRGDPSDNIPGVRGIGEKTATTLIASYGTIDALYGVLKKDPENLAKIGIKEGMIEKLKAQEEEARFSKMLADIRRDAPIDFKLPEKEWREGVEKDKVLDLLSDLEFRSLIPRVRNALGSAGAEEEKGSAAEEVKGEEFDFKKEEENLPKEEVENLALAVWVIDSNITQPALEDIYRIAKTKDFTKAGEVLRERIKKDELSFVYDEIELPLKPVLRRMEARGLLVDPAFLGELSSEYHRRLDDLSRKIYALAGEEFNINSPRQLSEVLFDRLGLSLKHHKKTSTGVRSTRESELEKMKELHPIIGEVLSYRELQKLLSTYIDTIPAVLDGEHRLHTSFIQTGTTTGRLSSQEPNLQNIPIKTDLGRIIRRAFVSPEGFDLVSFDYSQIELRLAAILSGDDVLGAIFREGGDVHAAVASRVFNVPQSEVTYEQRRRAKVINFGMLYGMGVNALREGLGTTRSEAQAFYNSYFETFPRLASYLEEIKADAARLGYTTTLFGRRRYFEGIRSKIPYVRAAAERMAINAPLQGTQADVVKLAMIRIDELFKKEAPESAYTTLQVHDELLFELKEDLVDSLAPKIRAIMEDVIPLEKLRGVPITAKGMRGKTWGSMKEL